MGVQPISSVARADRGKNGGFALIEILCVLAIIGLLSAVMLPGIPRSTSRTKLEGFAVQTALLLKEDRNGAIFRRARIATLVDPKIRLIRSGVSGREVRFPTDVIIDAKLASRCANRVAGRSIEFFPSGMSCGGTIALSRPGTTLEVRVNWLTGSIEVVPKATL